MEYFGTTNTDKSIVTSNEWHIDSMINGATALNFENGSACWDMADPSSSTIETKMVACGITVGGAAKHGIAKITEQHNSGGTDYIYVKFTQFQTANKNSVNTWERFGKGNLNGKFKTNFSSITWDGAWFQTSPSANIVLPITSIELSSVSLGTGVDYLYDYSGAVLYDSYRGVGTVDFNVTIKLKPNISFTYKDPSRYFSGVLRLYVKGNNPSWLDTLIKNDDGQYIEQVYRSQDKKICEVTLYPDTATNSYKFNYFSSNEDWTSDDNSYLSFSHYSNILL